MAIRASAAEVKVVKDTDVSDADVLSGFITPASLVVDRVAAGCGSDLTTDELKQVEIWYSAHLLSTFDPVLVEEKFEGATNKFQRGGDSSAGGVMSTQYGQMANSLSGGCLVEEDMRAPQLAFA